MKKIQKILTILITLALIGVASAAIYVAFNPEAGIYFDRPSPGTEDMSVQTFVQTESGVWTSDYIYGTMGDDILSLNILHKNSNLSTFDGIVYLEIECAQGLVDNIPGLEGIQDFETIIYATPAGEVIQCNNDSMITRISETKIRIVPTLDTYAFGYGVEVPSHIYIEFVPIAYGDYTLEIFVDDVDAY